MVSPVIFGIAFAAPLAACSDRTPAAAQANPAPAAAGPIVVRTQGGAQELSIAVDLAADTCTATTAHGSISVARAGAATTIVGAPIDLERAPAGDWISEDGARVARLYRDPARPGHTDVLDPAGIAIARIDAAAGSATFADADGHIVAHVAPAGGRLVVSDPRDAVIAYVQTDDAALAALLVVPLPVDVRAVAACDRLLPAPVSP